MNHNHVWKNFLISDLAGKVISVFKDVFLGIYQCFLVLYNFLFNLLSLLNNCKQTTKIKFSFYV